MARKRVKRGDGESTITKLTAKQAQCLFDDVRLSEEADSGFFENMETMRRFLAGDHKVGSATPDIVVNLVHSTLRSMLPTLFFREPRVRCYPAHPQASGQEIAWENALNFVLRSNGFKAEFKQTVFDALLCSEGWMKMSFVVPENGQQLANRKNRQATNETRRADGPWNTVMLPNALRISPANVVVDYLAPGRDPAQARFIATKHYRLYDELVYDPRYDLKTAKIDKSKFVSSKSYVSSGTRRKDENKSGRGGDKSEPDMVVLYEIYVERYYKESENIQIDRRMIVLADGIEGPLRDEPWEQIVGQHIIGFPIKRFVFNPVPDDYPVAEAEVWMQLQTCLNWLMTRITEFVTNQNQKVGIVESRFKDPKKAIRDLNSKKARVTVELRDNEGESTAPPWFVLDNPRVSPDSYQLLTLVVQFIERISQVGRNRQGTQANYRTATEAKLVDSASNNRDDERVDIIADYMHEIIVGFASVLMQFADSDFIYRVAGDTGRAHWGNFSDEELEWMPDIEIEANSFRLLDVREEAIKYQQILGVVGQLLPVTGPIIKLGPLVRKWLEALRIPNPDEILENMEGQREYQLLEVFMMMSGQEVHAKPDEPHNEHIEALDFMMASPVWNMLPPEARAMVMQHYEEHQQFRQQLAEQMKTMGATGQNPLDDIGGMAPANQEQQASAYEQNATSTIPGGGAF